MTVVVDDRQAFTLENFRRVAYAGERVRIGQKATRAMAQARALSTAQRDRGPLSASFALLESATRVGLALGRAEIGYSVAWA
jgi:hypothetical protein